MHLDQCVGCGASFTPNIKHIIAYVNGQSIYSKFCKICIKKHWEEFAKDHPELFKSIQKEIK